MIDNQNERHRYREVASIQDVLEGKLKHADSGGKEILLANSGGKVYALCDRCSYMNAPLSEGTLNGKVVTCAMHGARFDVSTGKKLAEPMLMDPSEFPEPLPESLQKAFTHTGEIMAKIKTYDQPTYETKVEGNKISVKI